MTRLFEDSRSKEVYISILGSGGTGKTTLGTALIHRQAIKNRFDDFRWFLSCEGVTDAEGLRSAIANAFAMNEKTLIPSLQRLARMVDSEMMLLPDNLETPREPTTSRQAVEQLLLQLVDVPGLSIVVTLRGAQRPTGIPWTRPFLPTLQSLSREDSMLTFTSISDVSEDAPCLNELMDVVDGLPLAITLMAAQAQYISCESLLKQWNDKRTHRTSSTQKLFWQSVKLMDKK